MYAVLSGDLTIVGHLSARLLDRIRRELTLRIFDLDPDKHETKVCFRQQGDRMSVPRQYGLALCEELGLEVLDETVAHAMDDGVGLDPIQLRPAQVPFVQSALEAMEDHYDVTLQSHTGSGKSVMVLEMIRRTRLRTLVVVDQNFLADQWSDRAQEHLGLERDQIGLIQGSRRDYDKPLTIAMVQTLYGMEDPEFADHFGMVVFDESHITGARQFSNVLWQFPAATRLAVSATPDRKDSFNRVLKLHFGGRRVDLEARHQRNQVRFLKSTSVYSWYANISPKMGRFISEIADDSVRNTIICKAILFYYEKNRDILIVSDRIVQLENLAAQCVSMGMSPDDVGLVTGNRTVWSWAKDPSPSRRLEDSGNVWGEYTPICMQRMEKRNPRAKLEALKAEKRVLFTTYALFSKGVDVPRLSVGIDCTPRASAVQVHGRILRVLENKKRPTWVTIRDINSFRSEFMFAKRLKEYTESNAEIVEWSFTRGVRRHDAGSLISKARSRCERLKRMRIMKRRDGGLYLQPEGSAAA